MLKIDRIPDAWPGLAKLVPVVPSEPSGTWRHGHQNPQGLRRTCRTDWNDTVRFVAPTETLSRSSMLVIVALNEIPTTSPDSSISSIRASMSTDPPLSIAIIGAGIAGVTLAIALSGHNPNIHITIFESRLRFSEISAGVGLGPNAVKAMDLISPKITEAYNTVKTANLSPEKAQVWYDIRYGDGPKAGNMISEMKSENGFVPCTASRAQFLAKLIDLLPEAVEVRFGKRVIDVESDDMDEPGKTRVRFEDGTDVHVDAVIGCDGIRSACRRILLGDNDRSANAVYSGKYAYRKVVDMSKAIKAVGPEIQNRQVYLGQGGHITTCPIRNGKALNMVAFKDGKGAPWKQRQWVIPSSRDALLADFKGWGDKAIKLLGLIEDPEKWAFLMGPNLSRPPHAIKQAFAAYDQIRRPRGQELIKRSRKQGMLLDLQGHGKINQELRIRVGLNQKWVWDADLEGMLEQARALLDEYQEIK
ncbi:6-methylsalicylic acid decarboxylase [Lachnellula occidentalis]|uniref:6-methylsalicylic acid decarboxylase n=1 Tax=Lachnellula occidentalis TaxID=215460 RepID=A0A8H8RKY7_9HELO|nr:6-methylsalicylic acid decarboxylase [Lachnellula occidentalis]